MQCQKKGVPAAPAGSSPRLGLRSLTRCVSLASSTSASDSSTEQDYVGAGAKLEKSLPEALEGNESAMPWVYILECDDGSLYTGSTWNLEKRLAEHQNGLGANHTRKKLPVKLVFCEYSDRIDAAYAREKQIQGWRRAKKLALITQNYDDLPKLADTNPKLRKK